MELGSALIDWRIVAPCLVACVVVLRWLRHRGKAGPALVTARPSDALPSKSLAVQSDKPDKQPTASNRSAGGESYS